MDFSKALEILNEKSTEIKLAKKSIFKNKIEISEEKKNIEYLQKAKAVIIKVGEKTQSEIKNYIEETVTLAIQSVYGEEYKFIIEFDYTKREQFEVYFYIDHFGIKLSPRKNTCEGGVIDVCSFALRMLLLTLENPDNNIIVILDEPFKNVSAGYLPAVSQMVSDIADLMNLQIIMVTHIKAFEENADNVIYLY